MRYDDFGTACNFNLNVYTDTAPIKLLTEH